MSFMEISANRLQTQSYSEIVREFDMSPYTIQQVTPQLVYIKWLRNPSDAESHQFLYDLHNILERATQTQYFISDLRRGRIMSVRAINQLSQLVQHQQWGGSTAFSQNPISKMFVG